MSENLFALVQGYDKAPQSDWFRHCSQTAKPYVVIRHHAHSADVMWDYVTFPPHYDQILLRHERQIEEEAISIFEEYATDSSGFRVTTTRIAFTDLPTDTAELAAKDLYRLIESYVGSPEQPALQSARACHRATLPRPTEGSWPFRYVT
jgi:hypothetical protein